MTDITSVLFNPISLKATMLRGPQHWLRGCSLKALLCGEECSASSSSFRSCMSHNVIIWLPQIMLRIFIIALPPFLRILTLKICHLFGETATRETINVLRVAIDATTLRRHRARISYDCHIWRGFSRSFHIVKNGFHVHK